MSGLADRIDRISNHAKAIKYAAEATSLSSGSSQNKSQPGGPFTHAVLYTSLGDLIRDADSSELGLFTLVTSSNNHATERGARTAPKEELSRVEFHGATPLRRRREDLQKTNEPEPEIYAQAALKYLDRYQSVRPMPRACEEVEAMIERLAKLREHIQTLTKSLEEASHTSNSKASGSRAPSSPKSLANAEERRILELQAQISDLRKRKKRLATKVKPTDAKESRSRSVPVVQRSPPPSSSRSPPVQDAREQEFWNTPAAPVRTLHFSNNLLMDEQVDLGDVSGVSLGSPVGPLRNLSKSAVKVGQSAGIGETTNPNVFDGLEESQVHPSVEDTPPSPRQTDPDEDDDPDDEEDGNEGDKTVVLPKPPPAVTPAAGSSDEVSRPVSKQSPAEGSGIVPTTPSKPKTKVNNEMEKIVTKIWATVGEIIMPGHSFDASGNSSNRPPRAKETMVHLQSLASQSPSPNSPSAASMTSLSTVPQTSGQPSSQQILTAHLLFTLLSCPTFSMPLNALKAHITEKMKTGGWSVAGQSGTRILYACVAKKLVKIDRGRGEQVVKFDI